MDNIKLTIADGVKDMDMKEDIVDQFSEKMATIVQEESDKGFRKGFLVGLNRHTWMKDGVSYVGSGFYTLEEALKMARDEGLINEIK